MNSILDKLNEWIEPFKNWVMENHSNPVFWIGAVLLGLLVFSFTYNALHKD